MITKKEAGQKRQNRNYFIGEVPKISAPNFIMNPAELRNYLPKGKKFVIIRVYWITDWKDSGSSGQHCHTDSEEEIFMVIRGSAKIILDDDGKGKKKYTLTENNVVFVPRLVWHGFQDASKDFLLLALTTTNYDPKRSGYIEDYQEFITAFKKTLGVSPRMN